MGPRCLLDKPFSILVGKEAQYDKRIEEWVHWLAFADSFLIFVSKQTILWVELRNLSIQ